MNLVQTLLSRIFLGEVAAKVDSFNDIIVKTKVALKPLKPYHKPVPNEKTKSNTQSKPVAKPVILSESDVAKPKSLDLPSPKRKHNGFNNLPSPIPDVSRVVGNNGCDPKQRLCETPDLILTSSPLHKIAPKNCDDFLIEDRDLSDHPFEATNLFLSPIHSPTKQTRDDSFNDDQHQQEEPKSSAVYNFLTSQIDQRHLPKASTENRIKMGLSAFEIERNLKNVAKSETKKIIKDPVQFSDVSTSVKNASAPIKIVPNLENASEEVKEEKTKKKKNKEEKEEDEVKIVLPKKGPRPEEPATSAVFNFTSRKDVPDYISNDTSRAPSKLVIPKPDEPGIKLLSEALLTNFKEIQEVLEEEELIKSLEARPPSPCDVTFINDNVLIDGKSSLIQTNSKKVKLNISFLDNAEIYEYPSEISLLLEETHVSTLAGSHQVGHSVPALSGSLLATYTPKTTGDFQLGVTKTIKMDEKEQPVQDEKFQEVEEKPVLFSSGSTSDILF
ncbi:hypothetical protein ABEB36_011584 [Hypothenemus hampei]|uniref:Uncharacterized protein n=1 Tax=Hypothenemus hampei TaxID=57062 RepID=A0ABD1EB25_HYPHA